MAGGTAHLLRDAYRITDSPPTSRKQFPPMAQPPIQHAESTESSLEGEGDLDLDPSHLSAELSQFHLTSPSQLYPRAANSYPSSMRYAANQVGGANEVMSGNNGPIVAGKRNVCKFYAAGYCSKGAGCNFLHLEVPYAQQAKRIPKKTMLSQRVASQQSHHNQHSPHNHHHQSSKFQNVELSDCVGQIAMMCLDQHGCRYLQKELESGAVAKVNLIFNEVIPHIGDLMSDPFGNYLCQKLIDKTTQAQRTQIVEGCAPHLVTISKNMHGTRAVQRLIEALATSGEFSSIREALRGSVVGLIEDLNGNHVVQKCLHKMEPIDNQFIYDAVARHCVQVATHRHGCCVFQRCIDHGTREQKKQLVDQIKHQGLALVQDPYGNYVVQYALDLALFPDLPEALIQTLQYELYYLARQKFSSNVVEKCLKVGDARTAIRIMRGLLYQQPDPDHPPLSLAPPGQPTAQAQLFALLQDQFGNYVVQTCLSEGARKAPREYREMAALLRPVVHQLSRNVPYMKRIQNLLSLPTASISPVSSPIGSPRSTLSSPRNHSQGTDSFPSTCSHRARV